MRKTRFLILSLAVAIMLMGAGYAYWTETLTISNTVTTGELDFTFQAADIVTVDTYMDVDDESYCRVKDGDDNTIEIALYDMYPGAEATFEFELLNSGTMEAKVKNFNFHPDLPGEYEHFRVTSFLMDNQPLVTGDPILLSALDTVLNNDVITIEKGDAREFVITLEIDPAAGNGDVRENAGKDEVPAYTFSLTADGLQWNDDIN